MSDAHKNMIADLAGKAAHDALEAVVRTTRLCATPADTLLVLRLSMALIEAKARTVRAFLPGDQTDKLVDEITEEEGSRLAQAFASVIAAKAGGAR